MRIAIDYGHCLSGYDTGAGGCGKREEILTREVGRLVFSKLKALGHTVLEVDLQSSTSLQSSLNHRKKVINDFKPDLSISIHFNAGDTSIGGVEIFTDGYCNTEASRVLNNFVSMGLSNRGIKDGMGLALVGGVNHYAMIVECCFINVQNNMSKYNAEKFANNIVGGVLNKNMNEEVVKIKNVVVYTKGSEVDRATALFLKECLPECSIFTTADKVDYTKFETVYGVGGSKSSYTSYLKDSNFLAGANRYETMKSVLRKLGKL